MYICQHVMLCQHHLWHKLRYKNNMFLHEITVYQTGTSQTHSSCRNTSSTYKLDCGPSSEHTIPTLTALLERLQFAVYLSLICLRASQNIYSKYMLVKMCVHMCEYTLVKMCVHMCEHMLVKMCVHMCEHMLVKMCVHMCEHMLVCTHVWAHACVYTCL